MLKSQKQNKILFYFFSLFILIYCKPAFCNNYESQLQQADSLFRVKKFTQAFDIYENLHASGVSTPSMYLKMAYIKEGLGEISNAMFYLNQYYYSTFNKRALKKMEILAGEYQLSGYEYEDFEFFRNLILKNRTWINIFILAVCLLLLANIIYSKRSARPVRNSAITLAVFVCLFIVYNNFPIVPDYAITTADEAFVMRNPSSAADPITTTNKGDKLKVVKADHIWVKVEYNEQVGYIRGHHLLMIPGKRAF